MSLLLQILLHTWTVQEWHQLWETFSLLSAEEFLLNIFGILSTTKHLNFIQ